MHDILEKLTEDNSEKDLRSRLIGMFYDEGFSFDGEQETDTGRCLEFKKDEVIVQVII